MHNPEKVKGLIKKISSCRKGKKLQQGICEKRDETTTALIYVNAVG